MATDTQPITRADLREALSGYATAAELAQVKTLLETFQVQTNRRFDTLEGRFDALEARFDSLEELIRETHPHKDDKIEGFLHPWQKG